MEFLNLSKYLESPLNKNRGAHVSTRLHNYVQHAIEEC